MTVSLLISPDYLSKFSASQNKCAFLTKGIFEYENFLTNLISVLNNDNPMIYDRVITYLTELFK